MRNSLEQSKERFEQAEESQNLKTRNWVLLSLKNRNKEEEK